MFPNGSVVTVAGDGLSGSDDGPGDTASFMGPLRLAVDSGGSVYVADFFAHTVRRIRYVSGDARSPSSYAVVTVAGLAGSSGNADGLGAVARFNGPSGVAITEDGTVYVTEMISGLIRTLTTGGADVMSVGRLGGPFFVPYGIAADPSGNLYVTLGGASSVVRVNASGATSLMAGYGFADGSSGLLNNPNGVSVEADGTVLVADSENHAIRALQRVVDLAPLP